MIETGQCQIKKNSARPVVGFGCDLIDLPDGSCLSPRRLVKSLNLADEGSATVEVRYAGSFPVIGENQDQRTECVRKMLLEMKNANKTRPVLLAVSLSGIKVCSSTGESILMAHALKRISYATCHPEFFQFSFLAREPKAHTNIQHCHVFLTKSAQEAEELNSIVANAFNVAYACQRQSQVIYQPTFNELIRHQIELQREGLEERSRQQEEVLVRRLHQISTPLVDQRLEDRHQKRQKEQEDIERRILHGKERTCWAKKKVFEQTVHCLSLLDDAPNPQSNVIPTTQFSADDSSQQNHVTDMICSSDAETSDVFLSLKPVNSCSNSSSKCISVPLQPNQEEDVISAEECYLCPIPCCSDILDGSVDNEVGLQICHHLMNEKLSGISNRSGSTAELPEVRTSPVPLASDASQRPLSGKYQNDETGTKPNRDCSQDSEGRDIYQGPPTPIRQDSLRKMTTSQGTLCDELQDASWYQPGIPREISLEILSQQDIGSFIIRDSTTHLGCYALSVKVPRYDNPSGISHYLITRTAKGSFKIKGLDKEWPTLTSLVTHHTVMRELLPCLLHLPRPSNAPVTTKDTEKDMCNY